MSLITVEVVVRKPFPEPPPKQCCLRLIYPAAMTFPVGKRGLVSEWLSCVWWGWKKPVSPAAPRALKWDLHDWGKGRDWGKSRYEFQRELKDCAQQKFYLHASENTINRDLPTSLWAHPMPWVLNSEHLQLCDHFLVHASVCRGKRELQ